MSKHVNYPEKYQSGIKVSVEQFRLRFQSAYSLNLIKFPFIPSTLIKLLERLSL